MHIAAEARRRRRRANKNYDEFNSAGPFMNSTASLSLRKLNIKEYKTARGAFVFAAVVAASQTHTTHEKYVLLICADPREQASKRVGGGLVKIDIRKFTIFHSVWL